MSHIQFDNNKGVVHVGDQPYQPITVVPNQDLRTPSARPSGVNRPGFDAGLRPNPGFGIGPEGAPLSAGLDSAGNRAPVDPGRPFNTATVHGGTARFVRGVNGVAQDDPQRVRAEDMPRDPGLAGSARSISGAPIAARDLRPTDLVDIGSTKVEARVAERLGYLRRSPSGGYEDARQPLSPAGNATQQPQPQQATQADPISTDVPLGEEHAGSVAVIQRGLPEVFVATPFRRW